MPQNKKTDIQKRRTEIARYYFQGKTQHEIASLVSMSEGQVSQDLKHLREEWKKQRLKDIDEKIAVELAKIDNLERKYWEAWEKSVENYKKKSQKVKGSIKSEDGSKPDYRELTETEVIEFGEPRYLQGIERCIDKRCKLLGLEAPVKMAHEHEGNSFLSFLMTTKQ